MIDNTGLRLRVFFRLSPDMSRRSGLTCLTFRVPRLSRRVRADPRGSLRSHAGLARIPAKPGMGVDEGYMIVFNEMQRILAYAAAKKM